MDFSFPKTKYSYEKLYQLYMSIFIIASICIIVFVAIGLVVYFSVLDVKDEMDDLKRFDKHKNYS